MNARAQSATHALIEIVGSRLGLLAIVWAALALRVFRLSYQELRGDEAFGYFFSLQPAAEIVHSTIALGEPHPVGSYLLQKWWLAWAGSSEFSLRFISAVCGVLAVALIYRLALQLRLGKAAALVAAALLAISPYAIWHSQDARMYSLSLALTLGSSVLLLDALARPRWPAWLAYVGVTWLALHVHYFVAFVILAQALFVLGQALGNPERRRAVRSFLAALVLLGLLYLPWLVAARSTLLGYHGNGDSPGFAAMLIRSLSVFAVGETVPAQQHELFALLAAVLLALGGIRLVGSGPQGRSALAYLLLFVSVPVLVTWISAQQRPIFNERYLIAAAPPFYVLLAASVCPLGGDGRGWKRLATRLPVVLLVMLVLGAMLSLGRYYDDAAYSKTRGWRELAATLTRLSAGEPAEQARLAQNYPDPTLWYYYRGPVAHIVLPPAPMAFAGAQREVEELVAQDVRLVVLPLQPSAAWDDYGVAQSALSRRYTLVATIPAGRWPVQVWARPPAQLAPARVRFASGLVLDAAAVPESVVPGGVVVVHLLWSGLPSALDGGEKLSLQLLDAGGRLVAQADQELGASVIGGPATSYGILAPQSLPAGEYRLIAIVYNPALPGAPRLLTAQGADHTVLAVLRTP